MTPTKPTILVVDDDSAASLIMDVALVKAGFTVELAESGRDALAKFQARPSDLVMLDVGMPELDGYEVCKRLRAQAGALLPIMMVTGRDDLKSVEAAYECGATDFVAKPVNWSLIGHRVRYLLRSQQAMIDLQAAEARNAAVLNAIPDLLFELDIDGRYLDCRVPRADLLAAPAHAVMGKTLREVLPPAAAAACMSALQAAYEQGSSAGAQYELELAAGHKWFEVSVARKAVAAGEKPAFIMLSRDITERKEAESRIADLAYVDSLTGLPNRRSFLDRVDREIRRAERGAERLAVLFMDLDGFKSVNDTLGHAAGDLVLQWAAERLGDGLRPSDMLSRPTGYDGSAAEDSALARLGGDEFTALILDIEDPADALAVAQRVGRSMRRPFALEGREWSLSTSIGIALYPDDGHDATTLLLHADSAMYQAKRAGRDNAQLYSAAMNEHVQRRAELDSSMRLATQRGEFHLVYQPQIDVASGGVRAVEALIRWNRPLHGPVNALDFIPQAEASGEIAHIDQWVLQQACRQASQWHRDGLRLIVAVNLSPRQIGAKGFVDTVVETLAQTGLEPRYLELEITESALLERKDTVRAALQALRAHGVGITLDDFGAGPASLASLTCMPINHIKVDRCFVSRLREGGENRAINAVLAMAHSMGIRVTAECVETDEQVRALQAMACDGLQGHVFSRPVAASDIEALVARRWALEPPSALAADTAASGNEQQAGAGARRR